MSTYTFIERKFDDYYVFIKRNGNQLLISTDTIHNIEGIDINSLQENENYLIKSYLYNYLGDVIFIEKIRDYYDVFTVTKGESNYRLVVSVIEG